MRKYQYLSPKLRKLNTGMSKMLSHLFIVIKDTTEERILTLIKKSFKSDQKIS